MSVTSQQTRSAVAYDPHPLWLEAVERVVAMVDMSLAGKSTGREQTLALVEQVQPDLLVADVGANTIDEDVELMERARASRPDLRVIALSSRTDRESIARVLRSGASAYVLKTADRHDLGLAIRQAFELSVYMAQPDTEGDRTYGSDASRSSGAKAGLTRRELEILALVAQGHSNAKMAKLLWVTEQTVKFHLSNIYRKLDVINRTEASRWAHAHGLVVETPTAARV